MNNTPIIGQAPQPTPAPKLDVKNTSPVTCEKCSGESFVEAFIFRAVSAIASGTGKAGFWPLNSFCCASCGHINESFKPQELRQAKIVT